MPNRLLIFAAGVCGAAGVGLSAVAAHGGSPNTANAATLLVVHAPVFMVAGMVDFNAVLRWSAAILFVGLALFASDMISRDYFDTRLFAMAAPTGGLLMIVGWVGIALAALFPRRLFG
ncbi:DUF423 domain-containing protein [Mesorhizobium sp. ZMM04-5]|uniref:DUF423 domain-containing protein n=1 Tax=Mesorhizobium marinum TaxID=3228790 RepID=A0ABV3R4N2_9HYPH